MSLGLYVFAWILIILIVVALSLVIIYGRKIDDCRTSKVLWCYAGENGWRCDGPDGPGTITLQNQLALINTACNPVDCTTLGDVVPSTPGSTKFTVLPFDDVFECGIDIGFPCNPEVDLTSFDLLNFPGDPLIPTGNNITGSDLMSWVCNPLEPLTGAKAAALNAFTSAHSDAYLCQSVSFKGQPF
jgi:hypothetical protein